MFTVDVLGCWGAYPAPGEATAGYLITTDEGKVLIDCGSGTLSQLYRLCRVEDLSAVFISHYHHDHAADLGVLGYAALLDGLAGGSRGGIPIYLPHCPPALMDYWAQSPWLQFRVIADGDDVELPGLHLHFRRTAHPVECLSMRITHRAGILAYSADSAPCDALVEQARNADWFVCEASLYRHQIEPARQAGHLTSEQCGRLARAAGVKRLAITHLPHYGNLETLQREVEDAFGQPVTRLANGTQLRMGEM